MKRTIVCIALLGIAVVSTVAFCQQNDPVADEHAVITRGNVRFTILTPQIIRLEWSPDGTFEDRASLVFINRRTPVPNFTISEADGWLMINTDTLHLRYLLESGKFSADNLVISLDLDGKTVEWKPGTPDTGNLKGTSRTLDGYDGGFDNDGNPIELCNGVVSRDGWVLIDDSDTHLLDNTDWPWAVTRPGTEYQDWYFFGHGHDYKQALADFILIAGRIPMPPKFAFGYWWSRYWAYSDTELRKLVQDIKTHDIPIDVLIIDMDWHETWGLSSQQWIRDESDSPVGWTGYTWNRALFPEPERLLEWTDEQNLKTALNLHPASGVPPMEDSYEEFAEALGFDTSNNDYIPYAMADKKWAGVYFDVLLEPFRNMGVDFWWIDWQQYETSKVVPGLNNTWWVNYAFFTHMQRRGERPLLFHRWGGLGNHRYQIGFSGDAYITWPSLAFQPYFTITASNVGYGYWSHDIGGHYGVEDKTKGELYLRWLQFGIFSPIVRTHSTKSSLIERRFWKYPDYFEALRDTIYLRYTLVPYIYTAARQTYDTGISLCRPLYYDYPEQDEAYDLSGQYMFGDDMLVAPVTTPVSTENRTAVVKIWLPEGQWYEWFTGKLIDGGKVIERDFSLREIPVYVKAGAIIPMYPKVSNLQEPIDMLVISVFPGGSSSTTVYEDDGISPDYQDDRFTLTRITSDDSNNRLTVTIHPSEGQYDEMPEDRSYRIDLVRRFPPELVKVNGTEYTYSESPKEKHWTYDGYSLTASIHTPALPCDSLTEINIDFPEKVTGKEDLLEGMPGMFARLTESVEKLKAIGTTASWRSSLPKIVLSMEQTPTRINYHPETALEELERFHEEFAEMLKVILEFPDAEMPVKERFIEYLK